MQLLCDLEGGMQVYLLTSLQEAIGLPELLAAIAQELGWQMDGYGFRACDRAVTLALRVDEAWAGALHLVLGSESSALPCERVWPELNLHGHSQAAEVALLALQKAYRAKNSCLWLLFVEMWRYCRCHEIEELWSEITPTNVRRYQRLGLPLHIGGPLRPHWGEDCYPCRVSVQELEDVFVERALRSPLHRQLVAQAFREPFPSIMVSSEVSFNGPSCGTAC